PSRAAGAPGDRAGGIPVSKVVAGVIVAHGHIEAAHERFRPANSSKKGPAAGARGFGNAFFPTQGSLNIACCGATTRVTPQPDSPILLRSRLVQPPMGCHILNPSYSLLCADTAATKP